MKAHRKAILTIALVLSGGLVACDTATSVDPAAVRPQLGVNKRVAQVLQAKAGWSAACVAEKISPAGGTVTLGTTVVLNVPKKAVSQPTTFQICPRNDGFLSFDFTAVDQQGVEIHEFKTPLRATFSWSDAATVPDANRLRVLYLLNGQAQEILLGHVDRTAKTITVTLQHFSIYAIGIE